MSKFAKWCEKCLYFNDCINGEIKQYDCPKFLEDCQKDDDKTDSKERKEKKMAGKKNNSKIVKIRIDNYADLESITGKLAKAGLWVTTEDVEDWPSPTKLHYLCIGVDNEVCTIHKIDELLEDDK